MIYAILSIIPGLGHVLQGRFLAGVIWFFSVILLYSVFVGFFLHLICIWSASQKLTTYKQRDYIIDLGYSGKIPVLCKQSSKLIDHLLSQVPATDAQLSYLNDLGYQGSQNISKVEASKMIDYFKEFGKKVKRF